MIDINKKYRTRSGREVRIYATDGKYPFLIQGAVKTERGEWEQVNWTNEGNFMLVSGYQNDLIEVRPRHKRTVWLHVFKNSTVCATEEAYYEITNRIACIKVELDFEEGEGL
jgi:hypothetical protein